MASAPIQRVDIAVVGAGIAGLATALALARAGGPRPQVCLCDPTLEPGRATPGSLRALAITPASRQFLDRLGIWPAIQRSAQPLTAMVLTDSRPGAMPAPDFLHFPGAGGSDAPLAHMVVQDELRAALLEACAAAGVTLEPLAVSAFRLEGAGLAFDGAAGGTVRARLLVAADGGRSRLRDQAGLHTIGWDYDQSAIVATLAHSRDHGGAAIQHFLPGGPLALLPMRAADGTGRRSSIVWTARHAEAERLVGLGPAAFCAALSASGGHERGDLRLEDQPVAQPLRLRVARSLVAPRLALVGDAARTIHPLAGQGLNLGLADAEALARRVADSLALGLDPGSPRVLQAYERDRRAAQVAMAGATDALNRLFSNDSGPVRLLRDVGLGLVDRSPALKRWLVREASGRGPA